MLNRIQIHRENFASSVQMYIYTQCIYSAYTQYIGNRCPAREIWYKHCMKFVNVLLLQMSSQIINDVKLLVPEVPVMSTSRNFPGFTQLHILFVLLLYWERASQ